MKGLYFFVAISVFFPLIFGQNDDYGFKVCHRSDPTIDACLTDAIKKGVKKLAPGSSALGVPPIDPLTIPKLTIKGETGTVNAVQNYYNVSQKGFSNLQVANTHFDFEKGILRFTTTNPMLKQEGKYDVDGKILGEPIYGNGDSIVLFKEIVINHDIRLEKENKNNKQYFKIKSYTAKVNIARAHFDLQNLYDGDKKRADKMLKSIDDNWTRIFHDVKDDVSNSMAKLFESIAKIVFGKIPIDNLFPN